VNDAPGRGLRLALAGASHWHVLVDARYLDLAREADCEIVGLSDDDESTARRLGEQLGCTWTTDPVDLVERTKPDLVLATPRPDRAPAQVGALLGLNVPLFAEKPLGLRASDVWPLVEKAERGWVTVAFPNRCLPIWSALERLRGAGQLGKLIHASMALVKGGPSRYRDYGVPWMLNTAVSGGGPLRNFGIHYADLLNWQFGPGAVQVEAARLTRRMWHKPIEDYATALLRAADGTLITWELGYSHAGSVAGHYEIRLAAEQAYLLQGRGGLEIQRMGQETERPPDPARPIYGELFFDALRRLRAGQPPLATVRDCALANELVDAAYAAAGEPPRVPGTEPRA
jgi:predicted dehydrogenase